MANKLFVYITLEYRHITYLTTRYNFKNVVISTMQYIQGGELKVDTINYPKMREKCLNNPLYDLICIRVTFEESLSINWTKDGRGAIILRRDLASQRQEAGEGDIKFLCSSLQKLEKSNFMKLILETSRCVGNGKLL